MDSIKDFIDEEMWQLLYRQFQRSVPKFTSKLTLHCLKCGDKINSRYEGEMVWCSCGNCAIDETSHYHRVVGSSNEFELIVKEGGKE